MFWPLILPVQITFGLLILSLIVAAYVGNRLRRMKRLLIVAGIWIVLFVPTCTGIMATLDLVRFGSFHYQSAKDVADPRISLYLPHGARNLEIDKRPGSFVARYEISESALQLFVDEQWKSYEQYSVIKREVAPQVDLSDYYMQFFSPLQWPPLDDAVRYQGPVAGNGAGWRIWYSQSTQVAYQYMGYW